MKIAITADTHLTSQGEHPHRFKTLENLLHHCSDLGVEMLIMAGDLFDHSRPNFADFETVYRHHRPPGLSTHIIPGNHDPGLTDAALAVDDLFVYAKPHLHRELPDHPILFIPYREHATMGEEIAPFKEHLPPHRWTLIGHGDWSGSKKYPDPYEPGVYMPLTRSDLEIYQPQYVFLGHIHRPYSDKRVYYPGSPCPLNITETGTRRMLVYDTQEERVTSQTIDSPRLYFQGEFVILPLEDERTYIKTSIENWISSWDVPRAWHDRIQLRVKLKGYTRDRQAISAAVKEELSSFTFYNRGEPDLSELHQGRDPDRARLAQNMSSWVESLNWPEGPREPDRSDILFQALKVIYGE